MGTIFAGCFKWVYRRIYECSTEKEGNRKKVIVPSTACLWVIFAYILTGTVHAILFTLIYYDAFTY